MVVLPGYWAPRARVDGPPFVTGVAIVVDHNGASRARWSRAFKGRVAELAAISPAGPPRRYPWFAAPASAVNWCERMQFDRYVCTNPALALASSEHDNLTGRWPGGGDQRYAPGRTSQAD